MGHAERADVVPWCPYDLRDTAASTLWREQGEVDRRKTIQVAATSG